MNVAVPNFYYRHKIQNRPTGNHNTSPRGWHSGVDGELPRFSESWQSGIERFVV
jgi:hypothetical protein